MNTIAATPWQQVRRISLDLGLAGLRIAGFGFVSVGTTEAVSALRAGKDYQQKQSPSSLASS